MTAPQITHRTSVTEDMIDHLGHMNVRWYGVAARAASDAVVAAVPAGDDVEVRAVDLYTRHFREQLLGAELEVRSLRLSGGDGSLRLYHELRNAETDELAASFVHRLEARTGRGARRGLAARRRRPTGADPRARAPAQHLARHPPARLRADVRCGASGRAPGDAPAPHHRARRVPP